MQLMPMRRRQIQVQSHPTLEGLVAESVAGISIYAYIFHELLARAQTDTEAHALGRRDAEELVDISYLEPFAGRDITGQDRLGKEIRYADERHIRYGLHILYAIVRRSQMLQFGCSGSGGTMTDIDGRQRARGIDSNGIVQQQIRFGS